MAVTKRRCPGCNLMRKFDVVSERFDAHFFEGDRRWCSGGLEPTKAQKAARKNSKRGRSVRTMRG